MINFYSENDFQLTEETAYSSWIKRVVASEERKLGEVNYIFCDDEYLLKINQQYLDHDTYTDIISFDNSLGNILGGDIFISTQRVKENADEYKVPFEEELRRVMAHGVLHFCGYKDKTGEQKEQMRAKEDEKMKMFHVEQ
ncbi:rRNA maturation RNase YbeY [Salinimicrobium soli]|uniref:rRNA maturation RNase YbeY n=1 Tax=Salinimicrobium soli TaxID=1254399 RepID=UPI003AAEF664